MRTMEYLRKSEFCPHNLKEAILWVPVFCCLGCLWLALEGGSRASNFYHFKISSRT